ncbi:MAG: polyphosphate kinase, partial [Mycobacterium sp.]|nr:polyphosphate kinase [Mycobacterium sp.]
DRDEDDPVLLDQNGDHIDTWRERYPYDHRMPHDECWMARAAQV